MKKLYIQPRIETVATTPQQMLCASGGIKAQISGYNQNTGGGFTQTFVWLAGAVCSSLLFLGTACSTTNNPDQPKQRAELKPRTLVVTQQAVSHLPSAVRRLPQATITENGDVLDAIWSRGDEISFRNISHATYTDPETGAPVYLDGVLVADRDARIASFASNIEVWCALDDRLLLVYPKATDPAITVSGNPLQASYSISLTGQDGTLGKIASTHHHSYGIATITEVTPTVANAVVAEMRNLLTVCKFSFVDDSNQPLPIISLSISYGDGTYAGTYPETARVTVTQGTPCTVTVTPSAGGYALAISPTGNPTEVYVALLPEANPTKYSFQLESGGNIYTGTATARLIAGEYVVATNLKLTK